MLRQDVEVCSAIGTSGWSCVGDDGPVVREGVLRPVEADGGCVEDPAFEAGGVEEVVTRGLAEGFVFGGADGFEAECALGGEGGGVGATVVVAADRGSATVELSGDGWWRG